MDVCPISHIPIAELSHPVCFKRGNDRVFSAEHLVEWLKHYSLTNPLTGAAVEAGLAGDILMFKGDTDNRSETERYLKSAGYLNGRGGKIPAAVLWVWQASWPKRVFVATCVGLSVSVPGVFVTSCVWLVAGIGAQIQNPLDIINLCGICILGIVCITEAVILSVAMLAGYYTLRWILRRIFGIIVEIVAPVMCA